MKLTGDRIGRGSPASMLEPKPLDCRRRWYGGILIGQTDGSQMKFDKRVSPRKSIDWYKKVSRRFIHAYSCNQPKFISITYVRESDAYVPKLV